LGKGFQVCTHAIGDRGNHIVLNAYEKALKESQSKDPRLRVEHAQVVNLKDIPRFKELGVLSSMQPTHATSDMYWAEARLGSQRVKGAYAWQESIKTGSIILGGSDFPVESNNPLWGIYAAITRQDHRGVPSTWTESAKDFVFSSSRVDTTQFTNGWYPEQKLTREQAVRAFTTWAAYGAFEEQVKGSLESGKVADIVVLSKDIMTVKPLEILKTDVVLTMIGGEVVYQNGELIADKR
jgi:predicted amidohydrolase YtcJ